jgi:hypothetical protein
MRKISYYFNLLRKFFLKYTHSRAFTNAACFASHSLYLATVSTAHNRTSLPAPLRSDSKSDKVEVN